MFGSLEKGVRDGDWVEFDFLAFMFLLLLLLLWNMRFQLT
jgi:hypothetical protein